jgi:hypothetical protein
MQFLTVCDRTKGLTTSGVQALRSARAFYFRMSEEDLLRSDEIMFCEEDQSFSAGTSDHRPRLMFQ